MYSHIFIFVVLYSHVSFNHTTSFQPEIVHEANNVHSILQLVEAGLGVSILPCSLKQQYSYLKVSFYEMKNIPVNTEVVLAYKETNRNAALKWFVEHYGASNALKSGTPS